MKTATKHVLTVVFVILAFANLYIFVKSLYLSDDINKFEEKTNKLKLENDVLEKEIFQADSLQFAASLSAKLNFTKESEPVFFDNVKYALKR